MRAPLCAAALAAASLSVAAAQAPDQSPLDSLLARASWYVLDFIDQFTSVVAEERYVQDSSVALPSVAIPGLGGRGGSVPSSMPTQRARHRELKSDFLMVKSDGSSFWQPFRDVFEVDHVPVRDREERLTKLFLNPSADNLSRAGEIVEESSRYNLGAVKRTINNPMFGLMLLMPEYQSRFRFALVKADGGAGHRVWIVEFDEQERPSVIQGLEGHDMPARGRFWIEEGTGRVARVEVRVKQPEIDAKLTTEFRVDEKFGLSVPSEMREEYDMPGGRVSGVATYSRFRRFQVSADHEITPQ